MLFTNLETISDCFLNICTICYELFATLVMDRTSLEPLVLKIHQCYSEKKNERKQKLIREFFKNVSGKSRSAGNHKESSMSANLLVTSEN